MTTKFGLHFEELKASGDLPSPVGVARSILKLTRKPDVSLTEIAHVVQADPSLSGKLIKSANLLKAGTRVIASVSGALNLLGLDATRQLVIGFSIVAGNRRGLCRNFDYMKFWSVSLARAIIAQMLCEREQVAQPEECFIGALLSDIGSLALATLYPIAYSEILANGLPFSELLESERNSFAADHIELTEALLEDWMLPPMFIHAASHHRNPERAAFSASSREDRLCRIWHFSQMLAENYVLGEKAIVRSMPEFIRVASERDLDPEDLAALNNEAVSRWKEWSRVFEVPSLDLPSFEEMMAAPPEEEKEPVQNEFPLRVLAASDEMPFLGRLAHNLAALGHSASVATNMQEALQLFLDSDPQLVVCDLGEEGLAFAEALRELPAGKFTYLILLFSPQSGNSIESAFEAGADAAFEKPFSDKELAARILPGQRFVRMREELLKQSEELRTTANELAVANRRAQRASLTDQLTGLPNRRYAIERLASEWSRSPVLSCLMVDMDRFKSVNDVHGHDIGDEVIRHVSQILFKESRSQDAICRFGGEEFLAILPNTNASAAMNCAERFRAAIQAAPFVKGKIRLDLTVSIGVAARRPSMRSFETLIKAADTALYAAKQDGRNLVRQPRKE